METCKTLAEVEAAKLAYKTELLWKTMTQGSAAGLEICWAAEDALSWIDRSRYAALAVKTLDPQGTWAAAALRVSGLDAEVPAA